MRSKTASRRSRRSALPAIAALALLAGCGGDGAGDDAADTKLGATGVTATVPAPASTAPAPKRARPGAPRPAIEPWHIPFSRKRLAETDAYSQRHYGQATHRLEPRTIVEHYTAVQPAQAVYDLFAEDVPDVELHELPQVCSHFLVDADGTIFELVPTTTVCRHTVGLNDVAIGIEHVGGSDADVLGNPRQLAASLKLTTWLRCRFDIPVADVIGHSESLSSRYHHENVAALRNQTHPDFARASMDAYRAKLARRRC